MICSRHSSTKRLCVLYVRENAAAAVLLLLLMLGSYAGAYAARATCISPSYHRLKIRNVQICFALSTSIIADCSAFWSKYKQTRVSHSLTQPQYKSAALSGSRYVHPKQTFLSFMTTTPLILPAPPRKHTAARRPQPTQQPYKASMWTLPWSLVPPSQRVRSPFLMSSACASSLA